MLLNRKGLINSNFCKEKLTLKKKEHQSTWLSYYQNYMDTLYFIVDKCSNNNYYFNCRSHSILFTFRHMLELCLKYNREKNGLPSVNSHKYTDLYCDTLIVPDALKQICGKIDWFNEEEDGACYRYYSKKTGSPYFNSMKSLELGKIVSDFNLISSNGFHILSRFPNIDYSKRRINWDMTLHLHECKCLGQIRTDYDLLFELILKGILNDEVPVGKVYLPLLFYIRHSLELAFKDSLYKLIQLPPSISKSKIDSEHSLLSLYNRLISRLEIIDISSCGPELGEKYRSQIETLKNLTNTIHILDNNSRAFRFPFDNNSNPITLRDIDLQSIIKDFYEIDSLLTFYVDFLEDQGLLVTSIASE